MDKIRALSVLAALLSSLVASTAFAGKGFNVFLRNNSGSTISYKPAGRTCWIGKDFDKPSIINAGQTAHVYTEADTDGACVGRKSLLGVDFDRNGTTVTHMELLKQSGGPLGFGPTISNKAQFGNDATWIGASTAAVFFRPRGGCEMIGTCDVDVEILDLGDPFFAASKQYLLMNRDGLCLDVDSGSKANGAKVQVWSCQVGNPNQKWMATVVQGDDGSGIISQKVIQFKNVASGTCLDLDGGNMTEGGRIQAWQCVPGQTNQEWRLKRGSSTVSGWSLESRTSGKCVGLAPGATPNGTPTAQYDCDPYSSKAQRDWLIEPL